MLIILTYLNVLLEQYRNSLHEYSCVSECETVHLIFCSYEYILSLQNFKIRSSCRTSKMYSYIGSLHFSDQCPNSFSSMKQKSGFEYGVFLTLQHNYILVGLKISHAFSMTHTRKTITTTYSIYIFSYYLNCQLEVSINGVLIFSQKKKKEYHHMQLKSLYSLFI